MMNNIEQYLSGWKLDGLIGRGGYGEVYRIKKEELGYTYHAALKVIEIKNSSLHPDDILIIHKLKVGAIIEADEVFRGTSIGNYKTNGEVTSIIVE